MAANLGTIKSQSGIDITEKVKELVRLAQEQEIQQLMARFQATEPNGVAVQQLEVLVRTAVFQSANQLVAYLLQQAADRIDAAYQPKPGWQRKG